MAITGAGSGIGQALAIELANRGAQLALADIDEGSLAGTMGQLPPGARSRPYRVDVSSQAEVFGFADKVVADFGAAHFVVNNAGFAIIRTFERLTLQEIEKIINVNLWGVIYGSKAFLPIMLAQKEGCIVNISSAAGLLPFPGQAAYNMTKFAVRALTETLWQELEGNSVRAVVVHPGGIATNITRTSMSDSTINNYERKVMQGMLRTMTTTPEDCAKAIVAGLLRGEKRLLVGNGAKTTSFLSRLFPNSYYALLRRVLGL